MAELAQTAHGNGVITPKSGSFLCPAMIRSAVYGEGTLPPLRSRMSIRPKLVRLVHRRKATEVIQAGGPFREEKRDASHGDGQSDEELRGGRHAEREAPNRDGEV